MKIDSNLNNSYINKKLPILFFIAIIFMGIGYATVNSVIINYEGKISAKEVEGIYILETAYSGDSNANKDNSSILSAYQTNLSSKIELSNNDNESYITYKVKLKNSYDKPYKFDQTDFMLGETTYSNEDITFSLNGLKEKDVIEAGETIEFEIKFYYKNSTHTSNQLISTLNFVFSEYSANSLYNKVTESAVPDTGLNFHQNSSNSNGNGLFQLSSTANNTYPIYYYRGSVTNNNIKFAGYCWKIVRTTDTGGIKIIYNGKPSVINNQCENINVNSQSLNMAIFNKDTDSPSDVGYMYGNRYEAKTLGLTPNQYMYGNDVTWDGSKYTLKNTISVMLFGDYLTQVAEKYHYTCLSSSGTCSSVNYIVNAQNGVYYIALSGGKKIDEAKTDMFSNATSSILKNAFDSFYSNSSGGLTDYSDKIENTNWCNDRRTYNGAFHSKDTKASDISYFINYNKLNDTSYVPNLSCVNNEDNFTLKTSKGGTSGFGNNMLDYPIGTLTVDELMLAGLSKNSNTSNYLNIGLSWWTLSPSKFQLYNAYNYVVGGEGQLFEEGLVSYENVGIRPVISLKNTVNIISGTGTLADPYIVE